MIITFEQEHTEELEQLQKQKENERIQQELDLAIARIENEQIQRKLDAAIERLEEERSKRDAIIEDEDQASQQLLSAVEEISSQDSLTDENSEQQTKIEETLLTKAKKGYEDQYVLWDDEIGVKSQSSLELIEQETTEAELQQLGSEQSKRTENLLEKAQQGYKDQIDVSSSEEEEEEYIGLLQLRKQDEKKQHEMRLTEKGEVMADKTQIMEEQIKDKQNRVDHILAEAGNVRNQRQNSQKIETFGFLDVMLFKGFQHDIIKSSILQPILENSIGKPLLSLRNALKNISDEDLWKVLRDTAENIFEDTFILEASSVKKYFDEFVDELIPSLTKRNLKNWNHFNEAWNTLLAKYFFRKYRRMTREIMVM